MHNFFFIENPEVRHHIKDLDVDDGMKIRRILPAIALTVLAGTLALLLFLLSLLSFKRLSITYNAL